MLSNLLKRFFITIFIILQSCSHCKLETGKSEIGNLKIQLLKVKEFYLNDVQLFYHFDTISNKKQVIRYDSLRFLIDFDRIILANRKETPGLFSGNKGCNGSLDDDDYMDSIVIISDKDYNLNYVKKQNIASIFQFSNLPNTEYYKFPYYNVNIDASKNKLFLAFRFPPNGTQTHTFKFKFYIKNKEMKEVEVGPITIK